LGDALDEEARIRLARKVAGMSGAEIAGLARRARAEARRENVALTEAHVLTVCAQDRPGASPEKLHLLAVHEAGHALLCHLTGRHRPMEIELGAAQGVVRTQANHGDPLYPADILAELVVLMAGRAAERVLIGQPSTGAGGGEHSDLARATHLALAVDGMLGLGAHGPVWLGSAESLHDGLGADPVLRSRVADRLSRAEAIAMTAIDAHRGVVQRLADQAVDATVLNADEIAVHLSGITPGDGLPDLAELANAMRWGEAPGPWSGGAA
jgi:ATP-dependent Zn protease